MSCRISGNSPTILLYGSARFLAASWVIFRGVWRQTRAERRGKGPHPLMLFGEGRHESPVIVNMRHAVSPEHLVVLMAQHPRIPNYDGVRKLLRQACEEPV